LAPLPLRKWSLSIAGDRCPLCYIGHISDGEAALPRLTYSSETVGCGATIELDSGEVIVVSIARSVMVNLKHRKADGFLKRLFSGSGQKLYYEDHVYKNAGTALTLRVMHPEQAS
jgi:hypothetical protein